MRPSDFVDYYEILGLQVGATAEEVREAWKRCARLYHPDLNPRKTSFRFQRAKEAYDTLSDARRRRDYDRVYKLNKGLFARSPGARRSAGGYVGTPPGGRTPPSTRPSGAAGPTRRPPTGGTTRTAPGVGRQAGGAGPTARSPGASPAGGASSGGGASSSPPPGGRRGPPPNGRPGPGSSDVRSRTSFRPATIFKEVKGSSLIDQLKDAVTQGGASKLALRHNGTVIWEAHITSAIMDDITRFLVGPIEALLRLLGADSKFQLEITNEITEEYNHGNTLYDEGKLEEAKAAYKRCVERDKYFAPGHLSLGAVYEAQQDIPVAIKCYQNAVKIDPAGEAGRFARENLKRLRGY